MKSSNFWKILKSYYRNGPCWVRICHYNLWKLINKHGLLVTLNLIRLKFHIIEEIFVLIFHGSFIPTKGGVSQFLILFSEFNQFWDNSSWSLPLNKLFLLISYIPNQKVLISNLDSAGQVAALTSGVCNVILWNRTVFIDKLQT